MTSLREFVVHRIPIESFTDTQPGPAKSPEETDDIIIQWGGPAYLNFSLDVDDAGTAKQPPNIVVRHPREEEVIRHGTGRQEAIDHFGQKVAESPEEGNWGIKTLFFVKTFDEYTEEETQVGEVTIIKPTITHVDLYVQWDDLFEFGFDMIRTETDFRAI